MVISLMLATVPCLIALSPGSFYVQRAWIGEFFCDFEVTLSIWFRSDWEAQTSY